MIYYHNPRCSKSREGLKLLENSKKQFEIKLYLSDDLSYSEIEDLLDKLQIKPIEYGITKNFFTSLFIKIDKSIFLMDFRKKFYSIDPNLKTKNFTPHISLSYGNYKKNEKLNVINLLPELNFNFTIDKLCIVDVDETIYKWNIIKTFVLKK